MWNKTKFQQTIFRLIIPKEEKKHTRDKSEKIITLRTKEIGKKND